MKPIEIKMGQTVEYQGHAFQIVEMRTQYFGGQQLTFTAGHVPHIRDDEPQPFDLEAAKAGSALVTRDGTPARFVGHVPEAEGGLRVVAYVEGSCAVAEYNDDGRARPQDKHGDLFMAPKPKRTVWVNMNGGTIGRDVQNAWHYESEQAARDGAKRHNEWEGASKYPLIAVAVPVEIED